MNTYRFEGHHIKEFATDTEAFDYALGWHDDRDAVIEKRINGKWCGHSTPLYQPQYHNGLIDGAWIDQLERIVEESCLETKKVRPQQSEQKNPFSSFECSLNIGDQKYKMICRYTDNGTHYHIMHPCPNNVRKCFRAMLVSLDQHIQ